MYSASFYISSPFIGFYYVPPYYTLIPLGGGCPRVSSASDRIVVRECISGSPPLIVIVVVVVVVWDRRKGFNRVEIQ